MNKSNSPVGESKIITLLNNLKQPILSKHEINNLVNLNFQDGTKILSLDTPLDKGFFLDIIWLMATLGYDPIFNFLNHDWEKILKIPPNTSNTLRRKKILFDNPIFGKNKNDLYLELYYFKHPVLITEGAIECPKCGSMETLSSIRQTRSADEPSSIFVTCIECGNRWRAQ